MEAALPDRRRCDEARTVHFSLPRRITQPERRGQYMAAI